MHCRRYIPRPLTRRQMLARCAGGFGTVALAALMADRAFAAGAVPGPTSPRSPHFPPKCPNFIVLNGGLIPVGGLDNFNSGFLPATYQGSIFRAGPNPVANIRPSEPTAERQLSKLGLMRDLDGGLLGQLGHADAVESAVSNYE